MENPQVLICKSCRESGSGNFCSNCGQVLRIKRISLKSLIHEITHFFSHMDSGIRYTLKELIKHPGRMQFSYIEGNRINHQKPFSMYFICASLIGLTLYWVNLILVAYYGAGSADEGSFFHQYMVAFLLLIIPFSTLVTYLFFRSSGYNFAEIGVLQLYTISMFLLIIIMANFLRLIWPFMESRYIELPAILIYNLITFLNFFKEPKWKIIVKSILCASILFLGSAFLQDFIVENYSVK